MRIFSKLFFAMLLPTLFALLAMIAVLQWNLVAGYPGFLAERDHHKVQQAAQQLGRLCLQYGSWEATLEQIGIPGAGPSRISDDPRRPPLAGPAPFNRPHRLNLQVILGEMGPRTSLFDAHDQLVFGNPQISPDDLRQSIDVGQQHLGWLYVHRRPTLEQDQTFSFLHSQYRLILYVACMELLLCALVAFALTGHLLAPIRQLIRAYAALSAGNYQIHLGEERHDELGQLVRDFNQLALALEQSRSHQARWMADISHELRTPLTILRAELESILDGIYPLSTQRVQLLHQDVLSLSQLVEDLQELTLSDLGALNYRKQPINLIEILRQSTIAYHTRLQQKPLSLSLNVPDTPLGVHGDPQRLHQLFANLLENSIRYTEAPGQLNIQMEATAQHIIVLFDDSAPGVPDWALNRLFERLFRLDTSRTRKNGGSGLGLSLCQAIVHAHEGTIVVSHSPLGGLRVSITFPRNCSALPTPQLSPQETDDVGNMDHRRRRTY